MLIELILLISKIMSTRKYFETPVSDLAAVHGIVVALAARALVLVVRVLPGLGQRAVVPDVAVVREAVGHVAQLPLLLVLRIQL